MPKVTSGQITLIDVNDIFAIIMNEDTYQLPCTWQGSFDVASHDFIASVGSSSTDKIDLSEWIFNVESESDDMIVFFNVAGRPRTIHGSQLEENKIPIKVDYSGSTENVMSAKITGTMSGSFTTITKTFSVVKNIPAAPSVQISSSLSSITVVTNESNVTENAQSLEISFYANQGTEHLDPVEITNVTKPDWMGSSTNANKLTITINSGTSIPGSYGTITVDLKAKDYFGDKQNYSISIGWSRLQKGTDGKSISEIEEWYKTSNNESEPTPTGDNPSGWSKTITYPDENNRYLWNTKRTIYSDNSKSGYTEPVIISRYTEDGVSIVGIKKAYRIGNSATDLPYEPNPGDAFWDANPEQEGTKNSWGTKCPSATSDNRYIYSCERTEYSNGNKVVSSVAIIGIQGEDSCSIVITSTNGNIFKNGNVSTTLTANVYRGTTLINTGSTGITFTYKWSKNGSEIAGATSKTLTVSAEDVTEKANYEVEVTW